MSHLLDYITIYDIRVQVPSSVKYVSSDAFHDWSEGQIISLDKCTDTSGWDRDWDFLLEARIEYL